MTRAEDWLQAVAHRFFDDGVNMALWGEQDFFENLDLLVHILDETNPYRALAESIAEAARHGDWDCLALWVKVGGRITAEMRPTIVAALERRPRVGNPPKLMTRVNSWERALFVVQQRERGLKPTHARRAAEEHFGVSDTVVKADMKAYRKAYGDNRTAPDNGFRDYICQYVDRLTVHGVGKGWKNATTRNSCVTV